MFNRWLQQISDQANTIIERQSHALRGEVFELGVTLLMIAAGLILIIAGAIMSCVTLHYILAQHFGQTVAMGSMAAIMILFGLAIGYAGKQMEVRAARKWQQAVEKSKQLEQEASAASSSASHNRPHTTGHHAPASPHATAFAPHHSYHDASQQPPAASRHTATLDIVREHPMASATIAAAAAMTLGLAIGRSRIARAAVKSAILASGRIALDRYLRSR